MKNFVFVTTARSDFTYVSSVIDYLIKNNFPHQIKLIATGGHFDKSIGYTIEDVRKYMRKYKRVDVIEINPFLDVKESEVLICSNILSGLEKVKLKIDALLIFGDRYEILPIGQYSVLKGIPLIHFFGGECDISFCLDTLVRDSITKLAHIHFVSHQDIKARLEAMGEESRRIFVVGNPSISSIDINKIDSEAIYKFFKNNGIVINKKDKLVNVCYHPVTTERNISIKEVKELIKSLEKFSSFTYIWTGINNDPGYATIKKIILKFISKHKNHYFLDHLGKDIYFSLLKNSIFMIGNSSSGLLESATFNIPAVNIGVRQSGRLHGNNVIDVKANSIDITKAIKKALLMKCHGNNPFENKNGFQIIFEVLNNLDSFDNIMLKRLILNKKLTLIRVP